jgi:3-hydroxyisobutyrate dehydrogenase
MGSTLRVGFAGIGNMGWPMARNIAKAGYELHVLDADAERAALFASECGGRVAASPPALGAASDVLITMLPAGRDVASLVLGKNGDGALAGLTAGSVVVDMSSSDPVGTRELGALLRPHGVALVDAPVSGLVPRAESATLTIMLGADDERALDVVRPVLECLGERLIRIGSLGCGHAMKALNNIVAATAFAATAEALIVGKRFGLDPRIMTQVMSVSTGRSFHSDVSFPDHVLTRRFATGFSLGLLVKDVGIARDLSHAVDAKTPLIDLVERLWSEGRDEIGAAADNSAVLKRWERLNDVILESPAPAPAAASQSK